MTRASPSLEFDDLVVQYPGRTAPALDHVSLRAMPGALTAVVGPNGSGKSTLIRALLRLSPIASGYIRIGDTQHTAFPVQEFATRIAVVPQREEPTMAMRVEDFVALGRHAHRSAFGALAARDTRAIEHAIERAGIGDTRGRRTDQLSGGEWQRARIARALAQDTSVLVLDEPTSYLDIAHEMAIFELLDTLAREGSTVLLVSHQLNLVARFASHMVLLSRGCVAAAGTPERIMDAPLLEQVYDWPLVITRDPAVGAPSLLPLRGRARLTPTEART